MGGERALLVIAGERSYNTPMRIPPRPTGDGPFREQTMADTASPPPQTTPSSPALGSPPTTGSRSALFIVFLVVFIDLLGFGIVLPLLPLYGNSLLDPLFPGEGLRPVRGMMLGLLLSVFSLMQFLFAPFWGRVSDRMGRRPILLLGLSGSVVFYTLFGVATEVGTRGDPALGLVLLFLARIGAGIAGATISTAQAVIADCTPPEGRSRGMALIGAAFGIGFTFGPLLSAASFVVPSKGAPGFAAAAFSLLSLLLAVVFLPETLRAGVTGLRRRLLDWRGLLNALQTLSIGVLIVTFFLATLAFGGLESSLALVNFLLLNPAAEVTRADAEKALLDPTLLQKNLYVFAYVGFILMLAQGVLYRRLVRRVGEVPFLRLGVALLCLGLLGAVGVLLTRQMVSREAVLLTALAVVTLAVTGFAFVNPSIQALVSRRTDADKQGEVLGANQSASALARILGPMCTLPLFFLTESHILPYVFGAALLAGAFCLTLRLRQE
jgi:DHA1 family tetracycline resistance protein-like MFS transporter